MVMIACLLAASAPLPAATPASATDQLMERAPISPHDLVEVADISGVNLSPDGKLAAYRISRPSVERNDIALDWYVVPLAGGAPRHVGSGGVAQHSSAGTLVDQIPLWDPDSRGLRFRALVQGAVGIWHWREGNEVQQEVVDEGDIIDFALSQDGGHIRYTTGATRVQIHAAERSAYDEGTLVDARLDLMEPIAGGTIEDGKRIMQRLPGAWFARERILFDTPSKQRIIAGAGQRREAKKTAPSFMRLTSAQGDSVMRQDGSRAELVTQGGARKLVVTHGDGSRTVCDAMICKSPDLVALGWRPGHDMLLLFEREGSAREKIWLWRVGDREARFISVTDGATRSASRSPRCVIGRDALVCADSGPIIPPRLIRVEYNGRSERILDDPNLALRKRISATATPMRWPRGVTGVLLQPAKTVGPVPVVVQYYRCSGFLKGGVGDEIPMLPLVEDGIAVLCMDRVRGTKEAGTDKSYALALDDIEGAIDGLAAGGIIDSRRIGIGGLSFGSEVTLYAIRKSKRFAAATIASSQMTPIYYWANALPGRGFAEMLDDYWKIGDPDTDRERWRQLSAVYDVDAIDTPLLLQLPEAEARHVIELHTKLKLAGKAVDFYAFADEPHIKKQPIHKVAVYRRNLDWFRFWLKGEEDPDPDKAEQYKRWRNYRSARTDATRGI